MSKKKNLMVSLVGSVALLGLMPSSYGQQQNLVPIAPQEVSNLFPFVIHACDDGIKCANPADNQSPAGMQKLNDTYYSDNKPADKNKAWAPIGPCGRKAIRDLKTELDSLANSSAVVKTEDDQQTSDDTSDDQVGISAPEKTTSSKKIMANMSDYQKAMASYQQACPAAKPNFSPYVDVRITFNPVNALNQQPDFIKVNGQIYKDPLLIQFTPYVNKLGQKLPIDAKNWPNYVVNYSPAVDAGDPSCKYETKWMENIKANEAKTRALIVGFIGDQAKTCQSAPIAGDPNEKKAMQSEGIPIVESVIPADIQAIHDGANGSPVGGTAL